MDADRGCWMVPDEKWGKPSKCCVMYLLTSVHHSSETEMTGDTNTDPWVVCSCGNLIHVGQGSVKENRETREHPACGRKPNKICIPTVVPARDRRPRAEHERSREGAAQSSTARAAAAARADEDRDKYGPSELEPLVPLVVSQDALMKTARRLSKMHSGSG